MGNRGLIEELNRLLDLNDLEQIKCGVSGIREICGSGRTRLRKVKPQYILRELEQITAARTIDRTKYYLKRLVKSLSEEKYTGVNDLNLHRWKEYDDLLTDSLWLIDKRDKSGAHNAAYWGNFIPQIPNQFIRRYTKKNEWVLDTFLGSGTTLIECIRLKRKGIGIELQNHITELAKRNIMNDLDLQSSESDLHIITGDSSSLNFSEILQKNNIPSVQFAFLHPPYWDIIKFSDDKRDLSNASDVKEFLFKMGKIIDNVYKVLDPQRYMALVIGDKYTGGELVPLGFLVMQEVLRRKFSLISIVVKNFEQTRGKHAQKELWRYRALKGGFYVFKHEYIFLFKKT